MIRSVIFGAGGTGINVYNKIKDTTSVLCFVDNDGAKWGQKQEGIEIRNPDFLRKRDEYDVIYLGTLMGHDEVKIQIAAMGIPSTTLEKSYVERSVQARTNFLFSHSKDIHDRRIPGSVAECGVYRGDFAKEINRAFPDRTCHLFDTFEGFDERDYEFEEFKSETQNIEHLKSTSIEMVIGKMPYPDKVIIHPGYFPDTLGDLDENFCFVNLDMDLYKPTLEGLRFFYPRMSESGVILVHDYFSKLFPNVQKAIDDYEKEIGERLIKKPIGDDISIAIVK